MDFRQCPACQASVLDDDATECPFCGASMSGKPSAPAAKPAPASKAASGKPAAKPQAKAEAAPARKAPSRKVGETVADDDDPFGIDTSAVAQAPKVAPRPAKGRMIRVQCPMCETPGFISAKMQGRDVKCCNPDCMVPVFKAPAPPKKQDEEVTKGGGFSGKVLGISAGIALVLGGLLFWGFYLTRQEGTVVEDGTGSSYEFDPKLVGGNETEPVKPEQPRGPRTITLAQMKRQALTNIITAAQARDDNQRKAFGRQLAAEAHAVAGLEKEAREQIAQLQKRSVGGDVPYFQVEPLLLIGWQQLAKGDEQAARQTFEQAAQAYQQLPQVGRQVLTSGITLASAQAAFDQIPEAQKTLRQIEAEHERAKVAAVLHIAMRLRTFDIDQLLQLTSLDLATDPLAVAIAVDMASHGRWEQAVAWAKAQRRVGSREDCLDALATLAGLQAARDQQTAAVTKIESVTGLTPTGKTRVQTGLATGYLMGGDRSRAETALILALESFATISKPAAFEAPTMKQIHDSEGTPNAGLPDASPMQSAAVGALQLARLQATLDQQEGGWQTLLQAWDFTAGIAPPLTPISSLVDEFGNNSTRSRAEEKLYRQLNLRNRDQQFLASNRYRGQLRIYETAARDRFRLERSVLRNAESMGYADEVAAFRSNPGSAVASAAQQPYQQANEEDRLLATFAQAQKLFDEGKYREAAGVLADFRDRQNRGNEERRDLRAMQLGCRLLHLKKVDALLGYAEALKDRSLTEDTLEVTSALSVLSGQAPRLWERHQRHDLQPTQRVALYRGLVDGIVTHQQRQANGARTASTGP